MCALRRRYDTAYQLDRSQNVFPDSYIPSIVSRINCVANGVYSTERLRDGKANGAVYHFQGVYRPKIINAR